MGKFGRSGKDPNRGNMALWYGPVRGQGKVKIDAADYAWAAQFKWYVNGSGYAYRHAPTGEEIMMHRCLMGAKRGQVVHHRNRDPLDNRRENLELMGVQEHHDRHRDDTRRRAARRFELMKKWGRNPGKDR